jgi:hypothetical protein
MNTSSLYVLNVSSRNPESPLGGCTVVALERVVPPPDIVLASPWKAAGRSSTIS